jgi:hypothetical protein
MKKAKQVFGLSAIVGIFLLTGCGGGGGSASGTGTGYLTDAAMQGVPYTCGSDYFGNTAEDGSFTFKSGENCTFKFGTDEVTIASTALSRTGNVVTPFDIEEIKSDTAKVTRFLRLVQSLDQASDGVINLSNLEDQSIDLLNTLASDSALESTYNDVVGEFSQAEGSLVTAASALEHFKTSIASNADVVAQLEAIESEIVAIYPDFEFSQADEATETETEDEASCENVNPITGVCEDTDSTEADDDTTTQEAEEEVEEEDAVEEETACQNINPITGQCED